MVLCSLFYRDPDPVGLAIGNITRHGACVVETCRGLRRETLRRAGDRTGPRSVGATTRYGYKGRLLSLWRAAGICSIVHVTSVPAGLHVELDVRNLFELVEGTAIHFSGSLQDIFSQDQRALCLDTRVAFAGRSIENEHTAKLLAYSSHTRVP